MAETGNERSLHLLRDREPFGGRVAGVLAVRRFLRDPRARDLEASPIAIPDGVNTDLHELAPQREAAIIRASKEAGRLAIPMPAAVAEAA